MIFPWELRTTFIGSEEQGERGPLGSRTPSSAIRTGNMRPIWSKSWKVRTSRCHLRYGRWRCVVAQSSPGGAVDPVAGSLAVDGGPLGVAETCQTAAAPATWAAASEVTSSMAVVAEGVELVGAGLIASAVWSLIASAVWRDEAASTAGMELGRRTETGVSVGAPEEVGIGGLAGAGTEAKVGAGAPAGAGAGREATVTAGAGAGAGAAAEAAVMMGCRRHGAATRLQPEGVPRGVHLGSTCSPKRPALMGLCSLGLGCRCGRLGLTLLLRILIMAPPLPLPFPMRRLLWNKGRSHLPILSRPPWGCPPCLLGPVLLHSPLMSQTRCCRGL